MGPPGAAVFRRLPHGHIVLLAPALALTLSCGWLDWLWQRVALQDHLEPRQQPGFIGIAQRELHLAPADGQVHVHTGRCLGQRRWCWCAGWPPAIQLIEVR